MAAAVLPNSDDNSVRDSPAWPYLSTGAGALNYSVSSGRVTQRTYRLCTAAARKKRVLVRTGFLPVIATALAWIRF